MDADLSRMILHGGTRIADQLSGVLHAFEQATGLEVCFRTMSDRWRDYDGREIVVEPFIGHRSSFCTSVKLRNLPACMKSDHADLASACSPGSGRVIEPFVRTCHAGADEILLPLWSEGVLVAVLFVGQFKYVRHGLDMASDHKLRPLNGPTAQYVETLLLPLRSYLLEVLDQLDRQRTEYATGRRGVIDAYVRESLSTGPSLPELASRLSLSRSRASHVVRELTGKSFQDLVEERRIAVASDLLTRSDGTVAWVARQTGFNDVAYFCRYFKIKTGMTPSTFRTRYRRVVSV